MKHLDDSTVLLGLIVTTKPFEKDGDQITCSYDQHVDPSDLRAKKAELQVMIENLSDTAPDDERRELQDTIYFLDKILDTLGV